MYLENADFGTYKFGLMGILNLIAVENNSFIKPIHFFVVYFIISHQCVNVLMNHCYIT